ncbi:MAG: TPR end-of-group domain-containing protein, partial [Kiritimatiellia bacterium]
YLFDAGGNGVLAVKRFQKGAELYGFIVAGSNNARNGPWEPIQEAITAMWEDTHARFSLAERQIYTGGFSGGARVASEVAFLHPGAVAGVIGCSGGFRSGRRPEKNFPFVFFGTAGTRDFNLREMEYLDATLGQLGIARRLRVFEGEHTWPPEEICTEALEWMTLQAIRIGLRAMDPKLLAAICEHRAKMATVREQEGNFYRTYLILRDLVSDLSGLWDVESFRSRLEQLAAREDVKAAIAREEQQRKRRAAIELKAQEYLRNASAALLDAERARSFVGELKQLAGQNPESEESEAAQLALRYLLRSQLIAAEDYLRKARYGEAVSRFKIAAIIEPENGTIYYNLACAYALEGRLDEALSHLEQAVRKGFRDVEQMKKDQDLASLRGRPEFHKILEAAARASKP